MWRERKVQKLHKGERFPWPGWEQSGWGGRKGKGRCLGFGDMSQTLKNKKEIHQGKMRK